MSAKNHQLIITAQGPMATNVLSTMADLCAKQRCQILDTKLQNFGESTALIMQIEGSWHGLAKVENKINQLEQSSDLSFCCTRPDPDQDKTTGLPYQAQLIASNRTGILSELCNFFNKHGIYIDECSAETYSPNKTDTKMCQLQLNIRIPTESHIASLRDTFMSYCEELNLDALLEPLK